MVCTCSRPRKNQRCLRNISLICCNAVRERSDLCLRPRDSGDACVYVRNLFSMRASSQTLAKLRENMFLEYNPLNPIETSACTKQGKLASSENVTALEVRDPYYLLLNSCKAFVAKQSTTSTQMCYIKRIGISLVNIIWESTAYLPSAPKTTRTN